MSKETYKKLPRLFIDQKLSQNATATLSQAQAHYLRNVLRRKEGDALRMFNGTQGEWLGRLTTLEKKQATAIAEEQLAPQPKQGREIHLIFTPIKKARLDFLIEKAVELGVTHLHPVTSANSEVRKINRERLQAQIIEAAEQCERLTIPVLNDLKSLERLLAAWDSAVPVYACVERAEAPLLSTDNAGNSAILVGPEGGFTAEEISSFGHFPFIKAVSLGPAILRAETACLKALSIV